MDIKLCTVDGCNNKHAAKGFCDTHYYRMRWYGTLEIGKTRGKRAAITDTHKECTKCHEMKLHSEFRKRSKDSDKLQSSCRKCESIATKKSKYGLSDNQVQELQSTEGTCFLCRRLKPLVVDHDHECCSGERTCGDCVRATICYGCNRRLTRTSEQWILNAAKYIESNRLNGA
jgi:hypothetical protein